jgi:hypothetical protein
VRVTDCPIGGCGRTVGITKPLLELAGHERTAAHKRPDGTRCVSTAVDPARVYEIAGTPRRPRPRTGATP